MNAITVMAKARSQGITLWVQDGALKFKAPPGSLTDELRAEIQAEKQNIIRFLDSETIPTLDRSAPLALSWGQKWLWVMNQLDPASSEFNIPAAFRLRGDLDKAALTASFQRIIDRHEILRTRYVEQGGEIRQDILPGLAFELPMVDLAALSAPEREERVLAAFQSEMGTVFRLDRDPLLRGRLIRLAEREHVLILGFHHIICDNQSLSIFIAELLACYQALSTGREAPLQALPIQYADFAAWQNRRLSEGLKERQLAHWRQKLAGVERLPELEGDYPRPEAITHKSIRHHYLLPDSIAQGLKTVSQKAGCTLYVSLLATLKILLHQYSGARDLVVGTPVAGRGRSELEPLIGLFFNTVAIRSQLDPGQDFVSFLTAVKAASTEAMLNQEVPFGMLVDELRLPRQANRTPVFQVLFNMYSARYNSELPGLSVEPFHKDIVGGQNINSKFDITLLAIEHESGIQMDFSFKADLYSATTAAWLVKHFQALCQAIATLPAPRLADLPRLAPLAAVPVAQLRDHSPLPLGATESSIGARFAEHARRHPQRPAVSCPAASLSYGQLAERSGRICAAIRAALPVGRVGIVALLLDHSSQMVAALLGALQSGTAFVTMDPDYPAERLAFMLKDTQAPLLITNGSNAALAQVLAAQSGATSQIIDLDRLDPALAADAADHASPDDLAYIMYTSGSSGNPKGVMQTHRNVLHYTRNYTNGLRITDSDRLSLIPSFSFSAAMMDVFAALTNGASLHLYNLKKEGPQKLGPWLRAQEISVYHSVPTVFRHFVAQLPAGADFPALRVIDFGGEPVSALDVEAYRRHFSPSCLLVNGLGATELNVIRQYPIDHELALSGNRVPVGYAVEGTEILLIDELGSPVHFNHPGEIVIQSAHLSPGYWNLPQETERLFSPAPAGQGLRRYRTGDLGRLRPDGCLEHLGRRDLQIKVNGVRIEPGEIEAALLEAPGVKEAVVMGQPRPTGETVLVAYLVLDGGSELSPEILRANLLETLPPSMIPTEFVSLDAMPLTPTGKLDRRSLPLPGQDAPNDKASYQAPSNPVEEILARIWRETFKLEKVSVNANFFELGGDSLLSMQVIAKARQAGVHLSARQFFQKQTIAGLASVAKASSSVFAEQGLVLGALPLSNGQNWFFGNDQFVDPDRWNQRCLVEVHQPIAAETGRLVVEKLMQHHDALRIRFARESDGWKQWIAAPDAETPFNYVDLEAVPAEEKSATVLAQANRWLNSLSLTVGPLFRVVYFRLGGGQRDRILVLVHRAVADTSSFRIILEDLQRAFMQAVAGQPVQFPPKTTSFKYWTERLQAHAHSSELDQEFEHYWKRFPWDSIRGLPVDFPENRDKASRNSFRSVTRALSAEETGRLLKDVSAAHNTQAVDALLSALARTVSAWSGSDHIMVNSFNSLRTGLALPDADRIDVSRTVGHLVGTNIMVLRAQAGESPLESLKSIQEQYRQLPHQGIGFCFLEYLRFKPSDWPLPSTRKNQLMFSYMGRPDDEASQAGAALFTMGKETLDPELDPANKFWHLLELITWLQDGCLTANWRFSGDLYRTETIEALADRFMACLRQLIELGQASKQQGGEA